MPCRTSEPSCLIAYDDTVAEPVLTAKSHLPSWLISTQHGAVWPSGTGESPIELRTPRRLTWKADTVPRPAPAWALETYSWAGLVGRNSAPIGPRLWAANGEPAAAFSRPSDCTVKLSINDVLSRVPTTLSPVELKNTLPTPEPSGTATVWPGSATSWPCEVSSNPA